MTGLFNLEQCPQVFSMLHYSVIFLIWYKCVGVSLRKVKNVTSTWVDLTKTESKFELTSPKSSVWLGWLKLIALMSVWSLSFVCVYQSLPIACVLNCAFVCAWCVGVCVCDICFTCSFFLFQDWLLSCLFLTKEFICWRVQKHCVGKK